MTDYFDRPGLSHSKLEVLIRDPLLFAGRYIQRTLPEESSRAMDFGTVVDDALCGQPMRYAVWHGGLTKDGKPTTSKNSDAYRQFAAAAEADGQLVMTQAQVDHAQLLVSAVRHHKEAGPIVAHSDMQFQVELDWMLAGDIPAKGKPDMLIEPLDIMGDLKTTACTSLEEVRRQAVRFGYHRKEAWYRRGYLATRGRPLRDFVFISVCTEPGLPHVWVWRFDEYAVEAANVELDFAVESYQARLLTGDWERDDTKGIRTVGMLPWEVPGDVVDELKRRAMG